MNNKPINRIQTILIILSCFMLLGCQMNKPVTLQGSYKWSPGRVDENMFVIEIYDFNNDGTVIQTTYNNTTVLFGPKKGTYTVEGNKVVVVIPETETYKAEKNELTMQGDSLIESDNNNRFERQ